MKVIDIEPGRDVELVRYGPTYAVWTRFTATVEPDDPGLPVCHLTVAVEDGHAVCEQLTVERAGDGAPVTGTALRRIPLGEYTAAAVAAAAMIAVRSAGPLIMRSEDGVETVVATHRIDDEWLAIPTVGLEQSERFETETRPARRRSPGARVTDEDLKRVAGVYRAAHVARKPPTAAVAAELHVSRSTAGRYVQRARERGFLGPTKPRVAGEDG